MQGPVRSVYRYQSANGPPRSSVPGLVAEKLFDVLWIRNLCKPVSSESDDRILLGKLLGLLKGLVIFSNETEPCSVLSAHLGLRF